MGRLLANEKILDDMKNALRHAESAADTSPKSSCCVEKEHKEAMALYLRSWVIGPLKRAIQRMESRR